MSTNITVNGTVYSVPSAGETGWASSVSTYLIAVGSAFLSKSGGSFTLTANANFGATYGLISKYFTSYSSNPSTTGVIRLANNEGIGFRNAANGADLILKVNASNVLEYNGNPITALALGTADYVLRMNAGGTATEYAKLVDANIASGAAIAVNKLAALTASKAVATDASGFVSAATTSLTELNYLSGVTTPTGTGALVLANSPTLITPTVGAATATSINKVAITAPATSATLTLADGKTLTINNTLTFTGTDTSSVAFGTGGTVAYTANKLSAFAATTSAELAGVISDETGSGSLVFATSPSLTTPSLGAATATSINSTTIPSSKTLVVTTDKLSVHAATTSAELAGVISDKTGSGLLVFGTSPNITTPTGIVKGDVGLGNVDNTSDATKDAATATLTNKTLTSPNINTQATVKAAGELRFNNAGDTFYTGFKGGNAAANKIWVLPLTDGSSGNAITTDGAGNLSFSAVATDALNQYNVKIGNSGNTANAVNTALLGTIAATYSSATVTITNATPAVVTYTSHGLSTGDRIYFTTDGALPTGVSASTMYVITKVDANTFKLSTTVANCVAGTFVATSSAGSGTHTGYIGGFKEKSGYQGVYDGTAVPSGYIGEKISVTLTPSTLTGSYADVSSSLTLTKGVWMIYAAFTLYKTASSTAYCIFKLRDTTTPTDLYSYSWGTQSTATMLFSPHTIAVYVNHSNTRSYVLQAYDPAATSAVTFAANTSGVYGQQEFFAVRIA